MSLAALTHPLARCKDLTPANDRERPPILLGLSSRYVKMFGRVAKSPSGSFGTRSGGHSVSQMTSRASDRTNLAASMGSLGLLIFSMFLVPLRDFLGAANVAIILLLVVQVVAIIGSRRGGILAAVVAALSFDFFFTEPYLRLVITDRHDIITAVLLLLTGIATSELGALRVRRELERHRDRDPEQSS